MHDDTYVEFISPEHGTLRILEVTLQCVSLRDLPGPPRKRTCPLKKGQFQTEIVLQASFFGSELLVLEGHLSTPRL